jgi:hemoglobin/transferrin/lactoferrin receptor protein
MRDDATGAADATGDSTSLKAYLTYEYQTERTLFVGWGQSYNAPRLQDLYITGQHFPGNFFVANPDLKPERADTFEAGTKNRVRAGLAFFDFDFTYFVTRARDFIGRSVNFAGATTEFANLDNVRLHGFEAVVRTVHAKYAAGLSYGQTRSFNETAGESLEDTLPDTWKAELEYLVGDEWNTGVEFAYVEKQDRVPAGGQDTPSYFSTDFYAGFAAKRFETNLRLNNAFDRDHRKHGSGIKAPSRDLRLQVSYRF